MRQTPSHRDTLHQASAALQMRRPEDAERLARGVLKADRGNLAALQILANALLSQKRAAEAIEPLRKAARRVPDPALETLLARAMAAAGETVEAIDQLRQTIARNPSHVPALLQLADQQARIGRLDEAVAALEDGASRLPDDADLRLALGQLLLRRGDRIKARALFAAVCTAAPERHDAAALLAQTAMLDGDYTTAADLYRRVLGRNPGDALARINLGKCLLETGERAAGEAALRMAAKGSAQFSSLAIAALASTAHGRLFLQPSAAAKFLREDN